MDDHRDLDVAGLHGDAHWAFRRSELLAFLFGRPAGGVLMAVMGASQTYSVVNNAGHTSFALVQVTLPVVAVAGLVVVTFVLQRIDVGAHSPSQTVGGLLVSGVWRTLALALRWLSDPVLAAARHRPIALAARAAACGDLGS